MLIETTRLRKIYGAGESGVAVRFTSDAPITIACLIATFVPLKMVDDMGIVESIGAVE